MTVLHGSHVSAGLRKWELARKITLDNLPGEPGAAGRFHLGHAEALPADGNREEALMAVLALSLVWPEGRRAAIQAKALEGLW